MFYIQGTIYFSSVDLPLMSYIRTGARRPTGEGSKASVRALARPLSGPATVGHIKHISKPFYTPARSKTD